MSQACCMFSATPLHPGGSDTSFLAPSAILHVDLHLASFKIVFGGVHCVLLALRPLRASADRQTLKGPKFNGKRCCGRMNSHRSVANVRLD